MRMKLLLFIVLSVLINSVYGETFRAKVSKINFELPVQNVSIPSQKADAYFKCNWSWVMDIDNQTESKKIPVYITKADEDLYKFEFSDQLNYRESADYFSLDECYLKIEFIVINELRSYESSFDISINVSDYRFFNKSKHVLEELDGSYLSANDRINRVFLVKN